MLDCPSGFYGVACQEKCACFHMEPCHPETGTCQCDPGFFGARCTKGSNCSVSSLAGSQKSVFNFDVRNMKRVPVSSFYQTDTSPIQVARVIPSIVSGFPKLG